MYHSSDYYQREVIKNMDLEYPYATESGQKECYSLFSTQFCKLDFIKRIGVCCLHPVTQRI